MNYTFYASGTDEMQQTANTVKEAIVRAMKIEGVLPPDSDWAETHGVLVHPKGWFGKLMDAVLFEGVKDGRALINVVKIVGLPTSTKGKEMK